MDLYKEQYAIENLAHNNAYKKIKESKYGLDSGSQSLINKALPFFIGVYKDWISSNSKEGGAVRPTLKKYALKPEAVCYLTLRCIFERVGGNTSVSITQLSRHLATLLDMENKFRAINKHLEDSVESIKDKERIKKQFLYEAKKNTQKVYDSIVDQERVDPSTQVKIGATLLNMVIDTALPLGKDKALVKCFQLVDLFLSPKAKYKTKCVDFTPTLRTTLERVNSSFENTVTEQYPMVVPPLKWEGLVGGGYLTPRGQLKVQLVRTRNYSAYKNFKPSNDMLKACNALQETPWKINTKVLEVVNTLFLQGNHLPQYKDIEDYSFSMRLPKERFECMTTEEKSKFFRKRNEDIKEQARVNSKAMAVKRQLDLAKMFKRYDAIYFPHSFDTRGRLYPIASAINPQSDKIGQSMLTFGKSYELEDTGLYWLKVHGANTFGEDKAPFSERVQWVDDNTQFIVSIAEDPFNTLNDWINADDPFNFLAFCFEYAEALASGNPETFKSSLPVRMDATCSGLQHYSLLLRDIEGAKATNVKNVVDIKGDIERKDIYLEVVKQTQFLMYADIEKSSAKDKQWKRSIVPSINRKVCKKPTMTKPYGVSTYGIKDSLYELIKEGELVIPKPQISDEAKARKEVDKRVAWLGEKLEEAINKTVVSAKAGMDYLIALEEAFKEYRKIEGNATKYLEYTNPIGFTFKNLYFPENLKQVKLRMGKAKVRIDPAVSIVDRSKVKDTKARTGIAPNFIHSLDSTHLAKVWNVAKDEMDLDCMASIHDSFGCPAVFMNDLQDILREELAKLYKKDLLEDLESQILEQYPDMADLLPTRPTLGTLDVRDVIPAVFTFS
jgi:DNA-directed RNA polymerase